MKYFSTKLKFFGVDVAILSENSKLIDRINYIFRYYLTYDRETQIWFRVSIVKNAVKNPILADDGLLTNGAALIEYSYDSVNYHSWFFEDTFLPPLQIPPLAGKYLVLHGCAIRVCNQTALIIAPSFGGKTMLVYHAVKNGAKCITDDIIFLDNNTIIPYKKPVGIRDTNHEAIKDLKAVKGLFPLVLMNPLHQVTHLIHLDDLFEHAYYEEKSSIDWIIVPDKNSVGSPVEMEMYSLHQALLGSLCNSGYDRERLPLALFDVTSSIKGALYLPTKELDKAYLQLLNHISQ
ncbi:MAG: hypothetical protein SPC85_05475 [Eubacteriales bacterium]|nr:hypothetical protein [Eubacteriales bacterium]